MIERERERESSILKMPIANIIKKLAITANDNVFHIPQNSKIILLNLPLKETKKRFLMTILFPTILKTSNDFIAGDGRVKFIFEGKFIRFWQIFPWRTYQTHIWKQARLHLIKYLLFSPFFFMHLTWVSRAHDGKGTFFIIFECASMHLLVEIHNKYKLGKTIVMKTITKP